MNHMGRIDPQAALSKEVADLLGHNADPGILEAVIVDANGLPLEESGYSVDYYRRCISAGFLKKICCSR